MADTENSIMNGIPEISLSVEVSGMTQAEVDKTLTLEDCAADAKAVGDRFGNVESSIYDLDQKIDEDVGAVSDRVTVIEAWTGESIPLHPASEETESEETIADAITELQQGTMANVYPIGSIYMTTSDQAPSFFGTVWEEILITATWTQLKNGMRSHIAGTSTGTVHFWVRTA